MKNHDNDDELRAGEHLLTDIGQIVFLIVFFAVWITDSFIFRYSVPITRLVPPYIRLPIGVVLIASAVLLVYPAHKTIFGTPGREPGVVRKGMYRIVRHPMYFGSWLFFLGFAATTLSLASIGIVVLFFLFYLYVARHEENYLESKYGQAYTEYKTAVPMLFPLPKRRKRRSY